MSSWHALHFNKIAKVLRKKRENLKTSNDYYDRGLCGQGQLKLLNELTLEFAEYFQQQNEGFDIQKFIGACGYTKGDYINES